MAKSSARVHRSSGSDGSGKVYLIVGAIIVLFVGGFIALAVFDARQQSASGAPDDVQTYDVGPAGKHTSANVDYDQSPPVGGAHNPVWQNCGYYDKPVRDENAVHSLEHGAVWITYSPDLPQDQVTELQNTAQSQTYILVSPYPGLDSPWSPLPGASRSSSTAPTIPTCKALSRPTAWVPRPPSPAPSAPAARAQPSSSGQLSPG